LGPPKMPNKKSGHIGLAALLKYAIELKAYKKMAGIGNTDIESYNRKEKFKTNLFRQIHLNFVSKMNEINEMKELCRILLAEKHHLLKNIFSEQNFKLKLE